MIQPPQGREANRPTVYEGSNTAVNSLIVLSTFHVNWLLYCQERILKTGVCKSEKIPLSSILDADSQFSSN